MKNSSRFMAPLAVVAALALPALTNGCSSDLTNPAGSLCCTDFKVGADLSGTDFGVDASIKGQFAAFAQASGDLAAVATASLEQVSGACKAIATAGGKNADVVDANDAKKPEERVTAWCNLAVGRIKGTFSAAGSIKVVAQAPKCEASFSAGAKCQANCSADAKCDVNATPPTCEGGTLQVSCSGSCTAKAGATLSCEGGCDANCSGSCTAQGGVAVDCEGKCDGTCAAGGSAGGNGAQADGSCKGTCQGTCTASATAPAVKCSGSCKGSCSGSCKATAGASVKCDGQCDAKATPLSCKGGTLKASCQVDAKCDANCNASVQAKAECSPPSLAITASGSLDAEGSVLIDALRINLPDIFLIFTTRGKAFADMVANVAGSAETVVDPGKLGLKGTACLGAIVPVIVQAGASMSAAFNASVSVAGSVGSG
jgi:hypothetical protein